MMSCSFFGFNFQLLLRRYWRKVSKLKSIRNLFITTDITENVFIFPIRLLLKQRSSLTTILLKPSPYTGHPLVLVGGDHLPPRPYLAPAEQAATALNGILMLAREQRTSLNLGILRVGVSLGTLAELLISAVTSSSTSEEKRRCLTFLFLATRGLSGDAGLTSPAAAPA